MAPSIVALLLVRLPWNVVAIAPRFSWDTVPAFFHSCNLTGPWSSEALDIIQKFPMVTVEKGQGYNDTSDKGMAEEKILAQLAAVKKRDPTIATIFYMNAVLDWYFYNMHTEYLKHPDWWLRNSSTDEPVLVPGASNFNPPPEGMLVFDHSKPEVRDFWISVCLDGTKAGLVDGCFSDSSQVGSHGTNKSLDESDSEAFELGKIETMAELTRHFGGKPGKPWKGSTGVLIGKKDNQEGINAFQIEQFHADKKDLKALMRGVEQGYLVQAHAGAAYKCGCPCMTDTLAAFLIGAGEYSYYGTGGWIAESLVDVELQWCRDYFERPLGAPLALAVKQDGVWRRSFASGTNVSFDETSNKGIIEWSTPVPAPPPVPPSACTDAREGVSIHSKDITPDGGLKAKNAATCCELCYNTIGCSSYVWYTDGSKACHFHTGEAEFESRHNRISGVVQRSASIIV